MANTLSNSPRRNLPLKFKWAGIKTYALSSAWISSALIMIILGTLMVHSTPSMFSSNIEIFSKTWNPHNNEYGIIPMVFGTLIVMSLSLIHI